MSKIDRWVVANAISLIQKNNYACSDSLFAINLSGHSIAEPGFLEFLVDLIETAGIGPDCLCFEITETAAISNLKHAAQFISKLKDIGCRFALDDFGSGLSSFAYLKNLDVDYLKIDGSFVKDMLRDDTDAAMVEAINQIGHILGLKTVAEYVEDMDILERVKAIGINYAQGYGMHEPEIFEGRINNPDSGAVKS
jgi:EAL domain-containing protein (putative c-di-GMP-specific phosphodiesterase class I)